MSNTISKLCRWQKLILRFLRHKIIPWTCNIIKYKMNTILSIYRITFTLIRTNPVRPYERAKINITFASLQIRSSFIIEFSTSWKFIKITINECTWKEYVKHVFIKIKKLNNKSRYIVNWLIDRFSIKKIDKKSELWTEAQNLGLYKNSKHLDHRSCLQYSSIPEWQQPK